MHVQKSINHKVNVKFDRSHVIPCVQNDSENLVIIFCVYPGLSTVTIQAFEMLIWECPESPNMKLPAWLQATTEPPQGIAEQTTIKKRKIIF